MPENINHNWTDIATNLPKGRTILVLGPDAIPFYPVSENAAPAQNSTDVSFSMLSRRAISEKLNGQISHYYHRDNLFLFKNARAKRDAMDAMEECANRRDWLPDAELLRKIVAIPFPLILNLNPDKTVFEAFLKYFRQPQFDYFSVNHKPRQAAIDKTPDPYDFPLLYNLCGSTTDALDSVVLDHFDLFNLLKKLLNDEGVPPELTQTLRKADRFILLGFDLERWYFQLFLHYVNRLDGAFDNFNYNFPILSQVGEDSREFVMKQFNIEHFATNRADFDLLFQACEQQGILRKINDPASPAELQIRVLVAQNKMEEAFSALESSLTDSETLHVALPLLRGRYTAWLTKSRERTEDEQSLAVAINQIRHTLLTYANEIQSN